MIFFSGCSPNEITDEFNSTLSAEGVTSMALENITGDITVTETSGNVIKIHAIKRTHSLSGKNELDKVTIDVTTGPELKIVSKYAFNVFDVSVDYEIELPSSIIQKIENTTGNINTSGTINKIALTTGNINAKGIITSIKNTTGNIEAKISDIQNPVSINSVTGNIDVYFSSIAKGNLDTSIVTGNFSNHGVDLSGGTHQISIKLVTGNIDLYNL